MWEAALEAVAELDALMSLAAVADAGTDTGPMCRPKLVPADGNIQVRSGQQLGFRVPVSHLFAWQAHCLMWDSVRSVS